MGHFFSRFAQELREDGLRVYKVHFNGGEEFYYRGPDVLRFTEPVEHWPAWLNRHLEDLNIQQVYLYSDSRIYHRLAREVCAERGIPVFCFEEGYIRPDYITLDCHGVHANADIPNDPDAFPAVLRPASSPRAVGSVLRQAVTNCAVYYWGGVFHRWRYRHYHHHRYFGPIYAGWGLIMRGLRYLVQSRIDQRRVREILHTLAGQYFFLPLQVYDDAQVTEHSHFGSVERFIAYVMQSFAQHAPANVHLVIKHHPLDTRLSDHQLLIGDLANHFGVAERVHYLHHAHLPSIIRGSLGVVTINSTVGLSAIHHGIPVKPLGRAIYDIPGLAFQEELVEFWQTPGEVKKELYDRFRHYLIGETQANGNFYRLLPGATSGTGVVWGRRPWLALIAQNQELDSQRTSSGALV